MRILVYEYFSGGGFTSDSCSLSILCEGLGMLNTLKLLDTIHQQLLILI